MTISLLLTITMEVYNNREIIIGMYAPKVIPSKLGVNDSGTLTFILNEIFF